MLGEKEIISGIERFCDLYSTKFDKKVDYEFEKKEDPNKGEQGFFYNSHILRFEPPLSQREESLTVNVYPKLSQARFDTGCYPNNISFGQQENYQTENLKFWRKFGTRVIERPLVESEGDTAWQSAEIDRVQVKYWSWFEVEDQQQTKICNKFGLTYLSGLKLCRDVRLENFESELIGVYNLVTLGKVVSTYSAEMN